MNAKRLTALALAALMAASTTSVALASEKVEYDLDFEQGVYYRYDEDEGRIVKADDGYTFAPGEKIYVRVYEDANGDKFSNKKSYEAYAEWTYGDSWVKDVKLVQKKGDVTTPGATIVKYTLNLKGTALEPFHNMTIDNATSAEDALKKAKDILNASSDKKTNIINDLEKDYYTVGYRYNGTFYDSEAKAIEAAKNDSGNLEEVNSYWMVDGTPVKSHNFTQAQTSGFVNVAENKYYTSLVDALKAAKWSAATAGLKTNKDVGGYGSVGTGEGYTVDIPTDSEKFYVNEAKDRYVQVKESGVPTDMNAATLGAVRNATTDDYYDSDNLLHKVQEVKEKAYFYSDGTFYKKASEVSATYSNKIETVEASKVGDTITAGHDAAKKAAENRYDSLVSGMNVKDNIVESKTPGTPTTTAKYGYWVEISTKSSNTTKDNDIVGTLYVGTNKSSAKKGDDDFPLVVTLSNQTNDSVDKGEYENAEDSVHIEPDTRAVVKFADDASDEFEVEFGDDARFVFNARGQSKLNLAYNTKYDKDFAYDYDDANIDFLTFEGEPTTNRTGTLYIYADEDSYIYEVTPRGAKKINGAKYNHDEEAWEIRTRHLTSYAISDKKLKTVDQMENSSSSNSSNKPGNNKPGSNKPGNNNDKPNPDTGR